MIETAAAFYTRPVADALDLEVEPSVACWYRAGSPARAVAYRKILCFTDEAARGPFLGDSWYTSALLHYGIELLVVDISPELRDQIIEAQKRQYR